ncbi:Maf1 regulator-domain-containing protein [Pisolithus marmoratus]|nr:Maf1 regulator-domain-containing protein [Pisolithus marmoratus]
MKYIEFPQLSRLAQALTHEGPECSVHTRIEAYSCKNIKRDKKLFKSLEHAYTDEVACSPPLPSWLEREPEETPFGPMDKAASRKTLYLLIATLNIAFPDHEFSDVKPSHFNKEKSGASVLNALSTTLLSPQAHSRTGSVPAPRTYSSYPPISPNAFPSSVPTASSTSPSSHIVQSPYAPPPIVSGTHPTLYRTLDDVIGLGDCQVFSYTPDPDSDPHANDYSDDEDDVASVADEYSSDDRDLDDANTTFEFDADDQDFVTSSNSPSSRRNTRRLRIHPRKDSSDASSIGTSVSSSPAVRMPKFNSRDTSPDTRPYTYSPPSHRRVRLKRRVGALLWSSHWFFLNPKLKRILFISVWAHTKRGWDNDDLEEIGDSDASYTGYGGERFFGWEGGVGAGARALGLSALG